MPIDYRLAAKVIDSAMKGIESLVSGNYRLPALAYDRPSSSAGVGSSQEQYTRRAELPSIDVYVRDSSTPKTITNPPTAKEVLYRLLNFF